MPTGVGLVWIPSCPFDKEMLANRVDHHVVHRGCSQAFAFEQDVTDFLLPKSRALLVGHRHRPPVVLKLAVCGPPADAGHKKTLWISTGPALSSAIGHGLRECTRLSPRLLTISPLRTPLGVSFLSEPRPP